jgi:predicted acyl esterase
MPGQALRLSVSAASFPAYSLNPGTGVTVGESDPALAHIITLNLACGPGSGSCLRMSVLDG